VDKDEPSVVPASLNFDLLLGDKAYDSNELRDKLDQRGTKPVIPNRTTRKCPFPFSKHLYKMPCRSTCMVDLISLDPSQLTSNRAALPKELGGAII
jgi:hypothetical protein